MDLSRYSNEELLAMYNGQTATIASPDLSGYSDEELLAMYNSNPVVPSAPKYTTEQMDTVGNMLAPAYEKYMTQRAPSPEAIATVEDWNRTQAFAQQPVQEFEGFDPATYFNKQQKQTQSALLNARNQDPLLGAVPPAPQYDERGASYAAENIPITAPAAILGGTSRATAGLVNKIGDFANSDLGNLGKLNPVSWPLEIAKVIGNATGHPVPDLYKTIEEKLTNNADYWEAVLTKQGGDGIDRFLGETIGGFIPAVMEWQAGSVAAGVSGYTSARAEGEGLIQSTVKGIEAGAKRFILGKALEFINFIKNPALRRGAGATAMAGTAALEGGTPVEIATQGLMGAYMANPAKRPAKRIEPRPALPRTESVPEYTGVPLQSEAEMVQSLPQTKITPINLNKEVLFPQSKKGTENVQQEVQTEAQKVGGKDNNVTKGVLPDNFVVGVEGNGIVRIGKRNETTRLPDTVATFTEKESKDFNDAEQLPNKERFAIQQKLIAQVVDRYGGIDKLSNVPSQSQNGQIAKNGSGVEKLVPFVEQPDGFAQVHTQTPKGYNTNPDIKITQSIADKANELKLGNGGRAVIDGVEVVTGYDEYGRSVIDYAKPAPNLPDSVISKGTPYSELPKPPTMPVEATKIEIGTNVPPSQESQSTGQEKASDEGFGGQGTTTRDKLPPLHTFESDKTRISDTTKKVLAVALEKNFPTTEPIANKQMDLKLANEVAIDTVYGDNKTAWAVVREQQPAPKNTTKQIIFNGLLQKAVLEKNQADIDSLTDISGGIVSQEARAMRTQQEGALEANPIKIAQAISESRIGTPEKQLSKNIAKAQKKVDKLAEQAALKAVSQTITETTAKRKNNTKPLDSKSPEYGSRNKVVKKDTYEAALARLRQQGVFNSGIDPARFVDRVVVAAYHLEATARNIPEWTRQVKSVFGNMSKKDLDELRKGAEAKLAIDDKNDIIAKMQKRQAQDKPLLDNPQIIYKLEDMLIGQGFNTNKKLLNEMTRVIQEISPETSRMEVLDAITGAHRQKPLDTEPIRVRRKEINAELQQKKKLVDMIVNKQVPTLFGGKRQPMSDEARALAKKVQERKKIAGLVTTDPAKQVQSAIDTQEKRLSNRIKDLKRQIETGKKDIHDKKVPPTNENIKQMQAEVDALQITYDKLFKKPLSQEQRIKLATYAVDRSIAEIEAKIKSGDTSVNKKTPLSSPELDKQRSIRDSLSKQLKDLRDAAKPKPTAEELALKKQASDLQRTETALNKATIELERRIKENDLSPAKKSKNILLTQRLQKIADRKIELQKQLKDLREKAKPRKSPQEIELERKLSATNNSIKKIEQQIQSGDVLPKPKSNLSSPELDALRSKKEELSAQRDLIIAQKYPNRKNEIALRSYMHSLASEQAKIDEMFAKDQFIKPEKSKLALDKAAQTEKAKLESAKLALKTAREIYETKGGVTTTEKQQILDITSSLFKARTALEANPKDTVAHDNLVKAEMELTKINEAITESRWKNMSVADKIKEFAWESPNILRTAQAGGDISILGRQLQPFLYSNAKIYSKAAKTSVKSYFDREAAIKADAETKADPYYKLAQKAGVEFTNTGLSNEKTAGREEATITKMIEHIPVMGKLYAAGSRAFSIPMNAARLDTFKMLTSLGVKNGDLSADWATKPTAKDAIALKKFSNHIADFSLRSPIGSSQRVKNLFKFLNVVMYAPRFALAKVKLTGAFGLARSVMPVMTKDGLKLDFNKTLFKQSLKASAKYLAAQTAIAMMFKFSNPEENKNIFKATSADFMKGRIGNERYDFGFGLPAIFRLYAQLWKAEKTTASGRVIQTKRTKIISDFLRSKQAPIFNLITTLATGQDFAGNEVSAPEAVMSAVSTLWLNDTYDTFKNSGMGKAMLSFGAGFTGVGVQSYPDSPSTKIQNVKNKLSQIKFEKQWDDLTPKQQLEIQKQTEYGEVKALELKRKVDASGKPYVIGDEQISSGKEIRKQLSKKTQDLFKSYGISTEIRRTISSPNTKDFWLNDERYDKYKNLIAPNIENGMASINIATFENYPEERKREVLQKIVSDARNRANIEVFQSLKDK